MNARTDVSPAQIRNAWDTRRARDARARARDVAAELGVTESQLVASGCGPSPDGGAAMTTRLAVTDWVEWMQQLESIGEMMVLTRNEYAVIEKIGVFRNVRAEGPAVAVLDDEIDLRLFPMRWHRAFAFVEETKKGTKRSLQVFDAAGGAIQKFHLKPQSDVAAFDALVARYRSDDQSPEETVVAAEPPPADRPDNEIDVEGFQAAWRAMQDTHEFFPLTRRFGVGRLQALRLAPPEFVRKSSTTSLRTFLEHSVKTELPIMIFVGNAGAIEIHTGPVRNVHVIDPWLNVLDERFNLHVREDEIGGAWVVQKPTRDGIVTSLEVFAQDGENILLGFGKRKPGVPELPAWTQFASTL